jgi:hypothetical protein
VNMIVNLRVPLETGNFLTVWANIRSSRALFHRVGLVSVASKLRQPRNSPY